MRPETLAPACEHVEIPLSTIVSLAACAVPHPQGAAADPVAEHVWQRLGVCPARLSMLEVDAARHRAAALDTVARSFAARYPNGTIVELGSGLSTRHARLAELAITFVSVDEPPIAALREELFGDPLPYVQVAMALEDRRWSRAVVAASREVLVLVPDAFVDLDPRDVVDTLVALSAELPVATTIVAAHGPRTQLCVARPAMRHPSLEVRVDRGFGDLEAIRIPRLRWVEPPLPDDGADLPALARLITA